MPTVTARHWLFLFFLILSWGSAIILTKVAVEQLPPLWVTFSRLAIAALALSFYRFILREQSWSLQLGHIPWVIALALVSSAAPFLLIAWGTQYTSSSSAGILMGSIPLIVLGLAHIFLPDERMTKSKLAGFSLGFVGVVLIINPFKAATHLPQNEWLAFIAQIAIFVAAFCYASSGIFTRKMPTANNLDKATMVVITSSLLLAIACLWQDPNPDFSKTEPYIWFVMIYLGLVPTAIATIILFILLDQTSASFVSTSNYMIPIVTALGGIVFLGESLSPLSLTGFAIIMVGLVISNKKAARQSPDSSNSNHITQQQG
ncbi:MAG: DMT family transporter [Cohaesibacter sp.]|nr:DMT family transporter [Cohaesibacter sp.]